MVETPQFLLFYLLQWIFEFVGVYLNKNFQVYVEIKMITQYNLAYNLVYNFAYKNKNYLSINLNIVI